LEPGTVEINGVVQSVKVAHFRLAYSRKMFVTAFPSRNPGNGDGCPYQAFAFYGGVSKQIAHDNLKALIVNMFVGKDRLMTGVGQKSAAQHCC
jgi:hypothetical protein